MCPKMWELIKITSVCVCVLVLVQNGFCEEDRSSEVLLDADARTEDQSEKTFRASISGGRRSSNATRDSQLYSLLAARRRQLLTGRLATHINTIATLAHKPHKGNTTFAQLEIRDTNNSVVKRITFENSSNEAIAPTLKLITRDGNKETRRDIKPYEIRQFIPRPYQDNKSRAGFLNNRKRDFNNRSLFPETTTESIVIYVPPEKLEGIDKEVELDPEEEFQVDESNHGLYLLNYSDTDNVTKNPVDSNKTTSSNEIKDNVFVETTTVVSADETTQITTQSSEPEKEDKVDTNAIANSTFINNTKLIKIEDKENANQTLFMSEEIYNHFRPLETELPDEEMAPFIYFGQKLGGSIISDSLTNSPSISASTKSVNFIAPPIEKRKFNSRYSATEKYKNNSAGEEEINEDMDISVIKNVIEKNKVRNTVKGPAPARHVGLVNAYRKYSSTTQSTAKPTTEETNATEAITHNETTTEKNQSIANLNETHFEALVNKLNTTTSPDISNATESVTATPKNFTRTYTSLRRRPSRLTTLVSTENAVVVDNNSTTEKVSTSVYTAVVTSVSITSSVKGQNKTDIGDNSTNVQTVGDLKNITEQKLILSENDTTSSTTTTTTTTTTYRPYRHHRFRIKTSTTENSVGFNPNPTVISNLASVSSNGDKNEFKQETTTFKISDRITTTLKSEIENTTGFTIRPKRRRRPTTTTTTSTYSPFYLSSELTTPIFATTEANEITLTTMVTTSSSSESKSHTTNDTDKNDSNTTHIVNLNEESQNEEVLIEAEKTYTASYVLAGLGFLPVIAVVAFVFRNLLKKKTKEIDAEYEGYFDDGGDIKKESPITPVARPPLPTPTKPDQKWEFPRNKLRLQTLLGQGNFGQVWKAEADDLTGHDGLTRLVAVKTIKESASQKEKQELLHEIYIMQKIGTHPNVVTLLGCCTEQEPYLLIMEYVMCGKLLTYLRERRSRPDRFSGSGALTSRDLTVFAYCVARGMDYIASKGIVHRDLAARNVLVDHNKLCKIADFGMSRLSGAGGRARGALPVRWMAPEALLYGSHSTHTDVWAFGILLWEIVTLGSTPYAAMSGREVLTAVTEGYRLERPTHCAPALYRAMSSCWHADPSQRPTFTSLKAQLAELLDNEPAEGNYVDLESFYQESSVYSDPSAIIHDDDGLSAEYDRERRCFRELRAGPAKFDNRAFNLRDEELRSKFGGTQRMGGFGIRDGPFNDRNFNDGEFNDRNFADKNFGERNFADKNFGERNFADKNFNDPSFAERKDGKLSTSSFHRERERENPLVSRNSFNGFPRIGTRENHFQMSPDGRNKRVPEFECDI